MPETMAKTLFERTFLLPEANLRVQMYRRMKTQSTIVLVLFVLAGLSFAAPPPNVILFLADDMGMGDTSAYQDFTGNADTVQLDTPQMERLASMGMRFTDAHTPSSRCSPTRYGLLTGRYPWRNRLKYWVLFGSQGDPMIESDRPTLANLFRKNGYATAIVGKWHVGLRYRNSQGNPAANFLDADLTKQLYTTPLDHGFDFCRITSRSHGTSGPDVGNQRAKGKKKNAPDQNIGPGHIHGRIAVGATEHGRKLVESGPSAYRLSQLGGRHSDEAMQFLKEQIAASRPFFLYYPSNSNHGPYTPDEKIGGTTVTGAARTKSGAPMDLRHDYIYENDAALGRFLNYLEETEDPRSPGAPLIDNTIVVFTSDNGAERNSDIASGPFRSHKGSVFEGGHRVPLIIAWKGGGIEPGSSSSEAVGLIDFYATFSEILGTSLPDLRKGEKGAEDSMSFLSVWREERFEQNSRSPLFFNDHKERRQDNAVVAIRVDVPQSKGETEGELPGKWKLFFDAALLRKGVAKPFALYELISDQREDNNRIEEPELKDWIDRLSRRAEKIRNCGGVRYLDFASNDSFTWRWRDGESISPQTDLQLEIRGERGERFDINELGLGLVGGAFKQVDDGESILISFDRDVIVDSVAIAAGKGVCGGFYRVGEKSPLAIYCIDADNDAKDQQGILSDIGLLRKGEILRLDSSAHYDVEPPGRWRLQSITARPVER